jgi:hypothetical protein
LPAARQSPLAAMRGKAGLVLLSCHGTRQQLS